MSRLRAALLGALLAAAPFAAQAADPVPAAVAAADPETHRLAAAFMTKLDFDTLAKQLIRGSRANVLVILQRTGKTEQQAGEIFDQFLLPEFEARSPELLRRMEDILATDFTAAELQAVLEDRQNEARRSAIAKVPTMQADFTKAGQEWGRQVGQDAYTKNKAALQKLGLE